MNQQNSSAEVPPAKYANHVQQPSMLGEMVQTAPQDLSLTDTAAASTANSEQPFAAWTLPDGMNSITEAEITKQLEKLPAIYDRYKTFVKLNEENEKPKRSKGCILKMVAGLYKVCTPTLASELLCEISKENIYYNPYKPDHGYLSPIYLTIIRISHVIVLQA